MRSSFRPSCDLLHARRQGRLMSISEPQTDDLLSLQGQHWCIQGEFHPCPEHAISSLCSWSDSAAPRRGWSAWAAGGDWAVTHDRRARGRIVRRGRPRYPVLVHRAATLTPLRFANPSPPSCWIEDLKLGGLLSFKPRPSISFTFK